jgi:hypothetical protein
MALFYEYTSHISKKNPTGCMDFCVLSGRGLCDEVITRPEESSRLWRVGECDIETSEMRRSWPTGGKAVAPKQTKPGEIFTYT